MFSCIHRVSRPHKSSFGFELSVRVVDIGILFGVYSGYYGHIFTGERPCYNASTSFINKVDSTFILPFDYFKILIHTYQEVEVNY